MPYHVYIFELFEGSTRRGRGFQFTNLSEEELRTRIIEPWDQGRRITWSGRTVDSTRASNIRIFHTDDPASHGLTNADFQALMSSSEDLTNRWITGSAGAGGGRTASSETGEQAAAQDSSAKDPRRVMVVHGRNLAARDAMYVFLRSLALSPIEWVQAIAATGRGAPHNLDAVRAAMDIAQAVVVILTAEDQAGLLPDLSSEEDEMLLRGQPRQNVVLEAGLAFGVDSKRTILVELGRIRGASDFQGLNVVRLSNDSESRGDLRSRLRTAGCDLDDTGVSWMTAEAGGDFEGCVIPWEARQATKSSDNGSDEVQEEVQTTPEVARLLRTELLDIRNKVEMFRLDPTVPDGFGFPAFEWNEHRALIARDPDLYNTLEEAYTRAHRTNEILRWRRTVATSRLIGVNWTADGLEDVDASAQEAISALDILINRSSA